MQVNQLVIIRHSRLCVDASSLFHNFSSFILFSLSRHYTPEEGASRLGLVTILVFLDVGIPTPCFEFFQLLVPVPSQSAAAFLV